MKTLYTLFAFLFMFLGTNFSYSQQTMLSTGTSWYYDYYGQTSTGYVHIQSVKDTTVLEKSCKLLLVKEHVNEPPGVNHTYQLDTLISYQQDDKVYLLVDDKFVMWYDFNPTIGDVWDISEISDHYIGVNSENEATECQPGKVIVDSIGTITLSGQSRRTIYTSAYENSSLQYSSVIVEGIGCLGYLMPIKTCNQRMDHAYPDKIRCFNSPNFQYSWTNKACDDIALSQPPFSTQLYLEDYQGNKDTLTVGYNAMATKGVDTFLGEVDFGSPLQGSGFQAYIINQEWDAAPGDYYLKKQLVNIDVDYVSLAAIQIIFPYESLPVTISWDNTLFEDPLRDFSLITDWPSLMWFDVGAGWDIRFAKMKEKNQIVFPKLEDPQSVEKMKQYGFEYESDGNRYPFKTIHMAFGYDVIMGVQPTPQTKQTLISPNPVVDVLSLTVPDGSQVHRLNIYNLCGSLVHSVDYPNSAVDCQHLNSGVYVLSIDYGSRTEHMKFIKR